jgi:hypothetical protein
LRVDGGGKSALHPRRRELRDFRGAVSLVDEEVAGSVKGNDMGVL